MASVASSVELSALTDCLVAQWPGADVRALASDDPGLADPHVLLLLTGIDHPAGLTWPHVAGVRNGKPFWYSVRVPPVVRDVLEDGNELSTDLADLSASLRTNAERLLRDIKLAHAAMVARLDQATPGPIIDSDPRPRGSAGRDAGVDELDVPEFLPGN